MTFSVRCSGMIGDKGLSYGLSEVVALKKNKQGNEEAIESTLLERRRKAESVTK